MRKLLTALALTFSVAGLGLAGCGKIDNIIDCHSICSRYQTCFDSTYDVGACEGRCKNMSAADGNYQRVVDECNACISDRDCSAATFHCSAQCSTVIP